MKIIAVATLILCLFLQSPSEPQTVALAFENNRIEIVSVEQAQKEFDALEKLTARTPEQEKRYAALVAALGTWPTTQVRCYHWQIKGCVE